MSPGLVKDPTSASLTGAVVEGLSIVGNAACLPATVSGYSVPPLADGATAAVSKTMANGSANATASCADGTVSIGSETVVCYAGYGVNGSSCSPSVTGVCGGVNGVNVYSYPVSGWCSTGAKTDVDTVASDGAFDWTCSGLYGGSSANCTALKKVDGACGSANGTKVASAPSSNLCSV